MNEIKIEINGKEYSFEYYDKFVEYYKDNGNNVEPNTRNWFLENLKPEDVIFDIGAHIGLYSILFSQKTNNVYSFEPTSTYDNLLLPNLEKNNITNVNTFKLGFGSKSGKINEKIYKIWGESPFEDEYDFDTIDEYVERTGIKPSFIKIDVDGFERQVLEGMEKLLQTNNNIKISICTYHNQLSYRKTNGLWEK